MKIDIIIIGEVNTTLTQKSRIKLYNNFEEQLAGPRKVKHASAL